MKNLKKDIKHGEGNRLAPEATLFDPNDDSHVSTCSPIELKRRELAARTNNDETYRTAIAPDINQARQSETTRKRIRNAHDAGRVKPI